MKIEDVKAVSIIGAGLMGHGIAAVFARYGYTVTIMDVKQEFLRNAQARIEKELNRCIEGGQMTRNQCDEAMRRIKTTVDMREVAANADLIVEAVIEKIDAKRQVFSDLEKFAPPGAILASNTSGLPITQIASFTKTPERVVGTHFWNPPLLMRAVEVIRGERTSDQTVAVTKEILARVGKRPVVVSKDVPGQVGIRILYTMLREAISLVEKGVASAQDVDTIIQEALGTRLPILGVLELADLSGLDLALAVSNNLFKDLDASKEPHALLKEKVARGETGAKSGKGFYDWSKRSLPEIIKKRDDHLLKLMRER
jgi:3-hydroxybutyryl-CoA dehydrogenase